MSEPRLNGWAKVLTLFVPLAIAGLVAWGTMRSDVRHIEEVSASFATREVVNAQYDAILRELRSLHEEARELRALHESIQRQGARR